MKANAIKVLKRLKNPKIFLAVVSGILLILVNLNVIDVAMSAKVTEVVNIFLGIGVSIGVFSNADAPEAPVQIGE